jgi:hypothetical protein
VFLVDGPDKTSALDRLVAEDPGLTATRALRAHVATVFHAA